MAVGSPFVNISRTTGNPYATFTIFPSYQGSSNDWNRPLYRARPHVPGSSRIAEAERG
jgi:hypothetical protein